MELRADLALAAWPPGHRVKHSKSHRTVHVHWMSGTVAASQHLRTQLSPVHDGPQTIQHNGFAVRSPLRNVIDGE
jgi:hypothetical protein